MKKFKTYLSGVFGVLVALIALGIIIPNYSNYMDVATIKAWQAELRWTTQLEIEKKIKNNDTNFSSIALPTLPRRARDMFVNSDGSIIVKGGDVILILIPKSEGNTIRWRNMNSDFHVSNFAPTWKTNRY